MVKSIVLSMHFFALILLVFSGCAQVTIKNNYDLDFEQLKSNNSPWSDFGTNYIISVDSITMLDNKKPVLIMNRDDNMIFGSIYKYNSFAISQFIKIDGPVSNITLLLGSKALNYDSLSLTIYCLDEYEYIEATATEQIVANNEWTETWLNIDGLRNTKLICIEIKAMATFKGLNMAKEDSKLWLDNISIMLDSIEIEQVEQVAQLPYNHFDCSKMVLLSDSIKYAGAGMIHDFQNHRIIALGESVHGSETINLFAFNAIKSLIVNDNCKLVLLEFNFGKVMQLNHYVQGYQNVNFDSLFANWPMLFSPKAHYDFLKWLKEYNDTVSISKKVNIVGVDIAPITIEAGFISEFIMNLAIRDHCLDSLLFKVYFQEFKEAYKYIQNNEHLKTLLGGNQYLILVHSLKFYSELGYLPNSIEHISLRDSIMWTNTEFALNTFLKNKTDKAVIYAHIGHVNKRHTFPFNLTASLGSYISEKYGDQYHVTGISVNKGGYTTYNDTILTSHNKLTVPPAGSLEHGLSTLGNDFLYVPLNKNSIQILPMRLQGSLRTPRQFKLGSATQRMDACVFINESKGFDIPLSWPTNIYEITKQIHQRYRFNPWEFEENMKKRNNKQDKPKGK